MNIKNRLLYCLRKALFFVLLWIRPLVHLPLRVLSFMSLLAFVITLIVPHQVAFSTRLMMASVGIGTIALSWVYDSLLDWISDDQSWMALNAR